MPSSVPPPLQTIRDLCAAHHAYRAHTLNLIASENVMSPWVEQAIDPGLAHRAWLEAGDRAFYLG